MPFTIIKQSGEQEEFDVDKFRRSLTWPGASPEVVEKIVQYVEENKSEFKTTDDLYRFAFAKLQEKEPYVAAKYHLQRALLDFGPTGFPFEKYIADILRAEGYECTTNAIVSGWCVDHEIDVIAKKEDKVFMVECKFHNEISDKSHVQVPLYVTARFHDIKKKAEQDPKANVPHFTDTWIINNTEFTHEALKYSNCMGIKLTSWNFPQEESLSRLIVKYALYPVTSLIWLNKAERYFFVKNGFILAKDARNNINLLKESGMNDKEIKTFIDRCGVLCKI